MEILLTVAYVYVGISVAFTTFFLFGLIGHLRNKFKEAKKGLEPLVEDGEIKDKSMLDMLEQVKNRVKVVYLERVGDAYYLYDQVSHSFIAQGNSEEEMWANAHLTFPALDFIIEGENGKAILVSVKDKQ